MGETFTVEVELSDNLGFAAVQFTLGFDEAVLDCISAETGALMAGMLSATNPDATDGAIIVGASTSTVTGDGTLGVFTFEVLSEGNYAFVLSDTLVAGVDGVAFDLAVDLGAQGAVPTAEEELPQEEETTTEVEDTTETTEETSDTVDTTEDSTSTTTTTTTTTTTSEEEEDTGETTYRYLFTDIETHWAADAIEEAAELGLVNGYGDGLYGPDDSITRGQLITILWRNAGSPEPAFEATFTDLNPLDTYYHDAVAWAEETGVINGYGNGQFGPDDYITREQMAAVLYRMGGENLGMAQMFFSIYDDAFIDEEAMLDSLREAVYWAVYNDIWCGTDALAVGDTLSPKDYATRGQIAVMLCAYQN